MTPVRYVRVRMTGANPYAEGNTQMTMDLLVDGDDIVARKLPFMGVFGPVVGQDTSPFVLRHDDSIDFGVTSEEDERMAVCNVRSHPIRLGQYVSFWISERDRDQDRGWSFKITAVIEADDLAKMAP